MNTSTSTFESDEATNSKGNGEPRLVDQIRARIVTGEFAAGKPLSDKELAVQFNTSRTPVREALLELRAAGLVVAYPQRGTYVFNPSLDDIREICETRGVIESGALRIAASKDLDRLVVQLHKSLAHMGFAIEAADFARIEAYDTEFHESMVAACGNSRLMDAYQRISDQVRVLRHRLPPRRQRVVDALAQHRRIVDLLAAERIDDAMEEVFSHVQRVHNLLGSGEAT
jgi:DNA-binding GntR family transcriptional regulator